MFTTEAFVDVFMQLLFNHPSFKETKPLPGDVTAGWHKKLQSQCMNEGNVSGWYDVKGWVAGVRNEEREKRC